MKKYTITAFLFAATFLSAYAIDPMQGVSTTVAPYKPYGLHLEADGVSVVNGGTLIAKTNGSGTTGTAKLSWGSGSSSCRISVLNGGAITSSASPDTLPVATGLVNGQTGYMVCTSPDGQTTSLNFTVRVEQTAATPSVTLSASVNGQSVVSGGNVTVTSAQNLSVAITNSGATNCYFYKDGYDWPLEEKRVSLGSQTLTSANTAVLSNISGKTNFVYFCSNNSNTVTRNTAAFATKNIQFSITVDPSYVAGANVNQNSASTVTPIRADLTASSEAGDFHFTSESLTSDIKVFSSANGRVKLGWRSSGAQCTLDGQDIGTSGERLFTGLTNDGKVYYYKCTNGLSGLDNRIASMYFKVLNLSGQNSNISLNGPTDNDDEESDVTEQAAACVDIPAVLKYGSRDNRSSDYVFQLQDFLNDQGYLSTQPTGFFGAGTMRAVKAFQRANGISQTGSTGQNTRAKIKSLSCNSVPTIPLPPVCNSSQSLVNGVCVATTRTCPDGRVLAVSRSCDTVTTPLTRPTLSINGNAITGNYTTISATSPVTMSNTGASTCYIDDITVANSVGVAPVTRTFTVGTKHSYTCVGTNASDPSQVFFTIVAPVAYSVRTAPRVLGDYTSCVDLPINFHRGSESQYVKTLQVFLTQKGFFVDELSGFYGDKTVDAVKDYQASKNLPITGMVYDFTRGAIRNETCN